MTEKAALCGVNTLGGGRYDSVIIIIPVRRNVNEQTEVRLVAVC